MVRRWGRIAGFLIIIAMALPMLAQEKNNSAAPKNSESAPNFYRLDLVVREMDGNKAVNTRTYTINQRSDDSSSGIQGWARFRVGSRIPAAGGYTDVGLNADYHVVETEKGPSLNWTIDLSSVAPETASSDKPVIRNVRSQGQTILVLDRPVVLSTSDDLSSTHKFVFEVTANKIK